MRYSVLCLPAHLHCELRLVYARRSSGQAQSGLFCRRWEHVKLLTMPCHAAIQEQANVRLIVTSLPTATSLICQLHISFLAPDTCHLHACFRPPSTIPDTAQTSGESPPIQITRDVATDLSMDRLFRKLLYSPRLDYTALNCILLYSTMLDCNIRSLEARILLQALLARLVGPARASCNLEAQSIKFRHS